MCNDRAKTLSGMLQIMNGFRPGTIKDKFVIVCTKPDEEWQVAQLTTEPFAPIHYLEGYRFASVEAAQEAVEELKATPEGAEPVAVSATTVPDLVGLGHLVSGACR